MTDFWVFMAVILLASVAIAVPFIRLVSGPWR